MGFNTEALHKGVVKDQSFGATITPIYQVSAFSYENMETLEKVFNGGSFKKRQLGKSWWLPGSRI